MLARIFGLKVQQNANNIKKKIKKNLFYIPFLSYSVLFQLFGCHQTNKGIFQKSCFGVGRNSIRKVALKNRFNDMAATFSLPAITAI